MGTLHVAFIWNQHQPYYKNLYTDKLMLPWVRLHGVKDYYAMAALLEKYPKIKTTINLTPCLLEQIGAYVDGSLDIHSAILKDPRTLSVDQKKYILQRFFDTNWNNKVLSKGRYSALLQKRNKALADNVDTFTNCDFLDLQVLFNLAWIDDEVLQKYPVLEGILTKKQGFSERDKKILLKIQREILSTIIPKHLELFQQGQVELITAPYFHPIVPLLLRFDQSHARWHLLQGQKLFSQLFHTKSKGLWLPELAIDFDTLALLTEERIAWTIADEDILAKTLHLTFKRDSRGLLVNPEVLYKPYSVKINGEEITVIFRDHLLSDLIGFEYNKMSYLKAVDDFIDRLENIYLSLKDSRADHLVTIALDGENPWNDYPEDKTKFLHYLYQRLTALEHIKTTTPSEFLQHYTHKNTLSTIAEGSWVDQSFDRWIGSTAKDRAWSLLAEADKYLKQQPFIPLKAELSFFASQGSDYLWWFDSMPAHLSKPFDTLFRMHLSNVYIYLGHQPPKVLSSSIVDGLNIKAPFGPTAMVTSFRFNKGICKEGKL